MDTIVVIGAGVMGCDVSMLAAASGLQVILHDNNKNVLNCVFSTLREKLRLYRILSKRVKEWNVDDILSHIKLVENYEEFHKGDIVIENIIENYEDKAELYRNIHQYCNPEAIYAVNTSCISITELSMNLPKPEKIVGMHFMNPVPTKDVVEMIRGKFTSQDTIEKSCEFLKALGIMPIIVNDSPGFVVNRLSHLFMNEAAYLVQEEVATVSQIDTLFKKGYNHKMGPLETADLIGLDTVANSLDVLYESYKDEKFMCCPLIKNMVNSGLMGRKSGEGFYKYERR